MSFLGHVSASIHGLLNESDESLHHMLSDGDGVPLSAAEAREILTHELGKGHLYIKAEGCDNFDPKKGCCGHVVPDEVTTSD